MIASQTAEPPHTRHGVPEEVSGLPVANPSDAETDIQVLREVPQRFSVHDEQSANWLVRRIMAARAYGQKVKEWAEQERHRAEREEKTLTFLFGRQIERWAEQEITRTSGKRKSLVLPAGSIGFRTAPGKLVVDDEMLVLSWAKRNCPNAVVVVEKLSKVTLDHYVHETGHAPDEGVHIEAASEKFYIR
jgi:hypothetical protein